MSPRTMGSTGRTARRAVVLAVGLVCALASTVAADYKESYRRGIQLIDARKYQEAIKALRQAADENPLEGGDLVEISGNRTEPYVPLYFIGLAYFRMGDCGRAGITWQLAKMGGEVLDHPSLAKAMREHVAACESGKAGQGMTTETAEAPAPAAPPPSAAAANSPRVRNLLQGARADLAGKRFARARQRAEEALALGADQALVDAVLADVADAERGAAARPATPAAPGGAPAATPVATGAGAPAAEAERQAMEAFFALDYGRARQILEPLAGQAALTPRGYLYLACSYAAEAVLTGRDVDAQVRRAREIYKKAQPGPSTFDADWRYISPRLRGLLEPRGPS